MNMRKAAEVVLNDLCGGAWGRITLEAPEEFGQCEAAGRVAEEARRAKKAERKRA
jgi:hypothetical protein